MSRGCPTTAPPHRLTRRSRKTYTYYFRAHPRDRFAENNNDNDNSNCSYYRRIVAHNIRHRGRDRRAAAAAAAKSPRLARAAPEVKGSKTMVAGSAPPDTPTRPTAYGAAGRERARTLPRRRGRRAPSPVIDYFRPRNPSVSAIAPRNRASPRPVSRAYTYAAVWRATYTPCFSYCYATPCPLHDFHAGCIINSVFIFLFEFANLQNDVLLGVFRFSST